MTRLLSLLLSLTLLAACAKDDGHCQQLPTQNIAYGNEKQQKLDIYPIIQTDEYTILKPIIFYVHGGGWSWSDKSQWDIDKVNFFKKNGFITVSIDFAQSPWPPEPNNLNRIKHPAHINDVARAFAWVKQHIHEYGGDPDKINIMGGSSGAHLVALLATNEKFLAKYHLKLNDIKSVITIDGGIYMTNDKYIFQTYLQDFYTNAFDTNDPAVIQEITPSLNVSPSKHIAPFLILHQAADIELRARPSIQFEETLKKNGVPVERIPIANYDHTQMVAVIGTQYDVNKEGDMIVRFLEKINKQ